MEILVALPFFFSLSFQKPQVQAAGGIEMVNKTMKWLEWAKKYQWSDPNKLKETYEKWTRKVCNVEYGDFVES